MRIGLLFLSMTWLLNVQAQTLSGYVTDSLTHKGIEGVHVIVQNKLNGTVTNENGYFLLDLQNAENADSIFFSALSYHKKGVKLSDIPTGSMMTIALSEALVVLDEVIIRSKKIDPWQIMKEVRKNFEDNYHLKLTDLEGFYREVIKLDGSYGGLTESVMKIKNIHDLLNKKDDSMKDHFLANPPLDMLAARRSNYRAELCLIGDGVHVGFRHILLMDIFRYWRRTFDQIFRENDLMLKRKLRLLEIDTYEGNEVYVIEYTTRKSGYFTRTPRSEVVHSIYVSVENMGILKVETNIGKHRDPGFKFQGSINYVRYRDKWYPRYVNINKAYLMMPIATNGHTPMIEESVEMFLKKSDHPLTSSARMVYATKKKESHSNTHMVYEYHHLPPYEASFWQKYIYQPATHYNEIKKVLGKPVSLEKQFSQNSGRWIINKENCEKIIEKYNVFEKWTPDWSAFH